MVNVAGCSHHKIARRELLCMKCCGDFLIESSDSFRGAFDRTAERMFGKICGVEELSQQFVRCVLDHFDLFEDDFLFTLEVEGIEPRLREQIGKQVDCEWQTFICDL